MKKLAVIFAVLFAVPVFGQVGGGARFYGFIQPIQELVFDATVHITSAQLKAMDTVPIVLIPAQGANTIIDPIEAIASTHHTDTTTYQTGGGAEFDVFISNWTFALSQGMYLVEGSDVISNNLQDSITDCFASLANGPDPTVPFLFSPTSSSYPTDSVTNQPLLMQYVNSGLAGTGGTATLDVEIIYTIHRKS